MRRMMTALALSVALMAGGCASTGSSSSSGTIDQVRAITQEVCGFLPTVTTVAQVIAAFAGGAAVVGTASEIGQAICNAVTKTSAARGQRPKVAGVVIKGQFVRR